MRCFWTYCLTGVQTGQSEAVHFWWCLSSSLLVRHLHKTPLIRYCCVTHTGLALRRVCRATQRYIHDNAWEHEHMTAGSMQLTADIRVGSLVLGPQPAAYLGYWQWGSAQVRMWRHSSLAVVQESP